MTGGLRLLAVAAFVGCSGLAEAGAGIVAVEVTAPARDTVEVGETLQLTARALDQDGESVAAEIIWATLDTTLSVDETGLVTGLADGPGRVQATSGSLTSATVTITVIDPTP